MSLEPWWARSTGVCPAAAAAVEEVGMEREVGPVNVFTAPRVSGVREGRGEGSVVGVVEEKVFGSVFEGETPNPGGEVLEGFESRACAWLLDK